MKKIVSHKPPRHMDDYLAICYLVSQYNVPVEYVHPQEVPEEYIKDKDIYLVDVGMSYNPELNNFDHHQDRTLPSSIMLILKHFSYLDLNAPFLQAIDLIDREGFQTAAKAGLVKANKETDEKRRVILLTEITPQTAKIVKNCIEVACRTHMDYEGFIDFLHMHLSVTPEFKKAQEQIEQEKKAFEEKLKSIEVVEIDGIKVGYSLQSLAPYHYDAFQRLELDLLIERNSMKPEHTSLIVNTSSPRKEKAMEVREKLIENVPLVFRHVSGFIVVVEKDVESFRKVEATKKTKGPKL